MVATLITAIMFICGPGLIGGCAVSNEGKVDFRKSTPKTNATIQDNLELEYKNFTVSESGKFVPGDSISIHLRTAYNDLKDDIQKIILPRTQKKNFNIAKELLNKIANPENDIEREHYAKRFFNMIKTSNGKEKLLAEVLPYNGDNISVLDTISINFFRLLTGHNKRAAS